VVEEKSFSSAAKKLHLTQPTISFHIDNLEKDFACPLFIRTAKGVTLTVYGERLFENIHKIDGIIADTKNQLKMMVSGAAGHIIIGASTIPGEYILPGILAEFLLHHPGVKFSLKTGDSTAILAAFQRHEFPIAIIGKKPTEEIPCYPLWSDKLVLVAHPDTIAHLPVQPSISHILEYPFVVRETSSGSQHAAFEALSQQGITAAQLNIVLQVGGNEALKAAILNKVGIGFISKWAVQAELASGRLRLIPFPAMEIERIFYALHSSPLLPSCVDLFWNYLAETKSRLQ
jgi:DNA-binding transcriptional LysR family regulator